MNLSNIYQHSLATEKLHRWSALGSIQRQILVTYVCGQMADCSTATLR